jgi:hypothetical protein
MVKEALQKDNGRRTDLVLSNRNAYAFLEDDKFGFNSDSITKTIELYYNGNIISCFTLELRDEDF